MEPTQKPAWVKRTPVPAGQAGTILCQGLLQPPPPILPVWAHRLWCAQGAQAPSRTPLAWVGPSGRPQGASVLPALLPLAWSEVP